MNKGTNQKTKLDRTLYTAHKGPFHMEIKWPGEEAFGFTFDKIGEAKASASQHRLLGSYDNKPTVTLTDADGLNVGF